MCRRSAWRWRATGRATDGGDRLGDPEERLSFAFLGGAVPALGGALDADLPAGQPGDRGAAGNAGGGAGVDGVRPGSPDEPMREDELEVVPLLQLGLASRTFDLAWLTRLGRAPPTACGCLPPCSLDEGYQARFEGRLESEADQRTAMGLAAQLGGDFLPLGTPRCWASTAGSRAVVDRASRRAHRERARGRPARWDGQSGSRRCRSLT